MPITAQFHVVLIADAPHRDGVAKPSRLALVVDVPGFPERRMSVALDIDAAQRLVDELVGSVLTLKAGT